MTMRNLFVYLTGPITAKHGRTVEDNVALAIRAYWACLNAGVPAFCPHLSAAFPTAHSDVSYETWIAYDFAVIDRCTDVVCLDHWEQSAGALREVEYARHNGKRVHPTLGAFLATLEAQ